MSDSGDMTTATQAARVADEDQHPALMTMRTRSGRVVRRPSGLQRTPVTSGRRTRRSVIPEQKEPKEQAPEPVEEKPAVCVEPESVEEKPAVCVKPEPVEEKPAVCVLPETVEEKPAVCIEPETVEEKPALCLEPQPVEPRTDAATEVDRAGQVSKAAPVEKAPATPETESQSPKKKPRLGSSVKATVVIPLGKPKSGRVWKDRNKQRFSALVRDSSLCTSWEKKMQAKREKELVQNYMLQLKEQKAKVKEDKRKRREENLKRRAENERKAEVVQVIRNPAKIKRMKKKQLRQIEKRDTLALLEKSKNNNQNQNNKTKRAKKNKSENLT